MDNSKRGSVPMQEKPNYRKSQGGKTPSEVKRMQRFPYASAIGSIIYVFVLNGGAVDWKSAKKSSISMSSTEAEYIAAAEASMKAVCVEN
ncbi:hypothetical protein Tco_0335160 [Tanacetum coccineum]